MLWRRIIPLLFLQVGGVMAASRTDNQTICDYYAEQRYGENNVTTQLWLMQGIVSYAYAGGGAVPKPVANSTGVFNKGNFGGDQVFLRSWFDGSKATTNLNGLAVKVDWLDGGGLDPLLGYLNGSTSAPKIREGSNQDILFSHWYVTFGNIYKCSLVKEFVAKAYAPYTPAYVHKYMDLNQTQVGYFIDQFIVASKYYGFSDSDAQQLSAFMNTKYNNKCSPPDTTGQLNSVCLAEGCPQAFPERDCAAYNSIGPYGYKANTPATGTATGVNPTARATSSETTSPSATNTSAPSTGGGSSSSLSAGAIAGIAIGGAAVLLLAVGLWLYFRRQQKANKSAEKPATMPTEMGEGAGAFSPQSPYGHPHDSYYSRSNPHDSYVVSTIGSPNSPPPAWDQAKAPQPQELGAESPAVTPGLGSPGWGQMHQIAEMESPDPPPGWSQRTQS